MRKLYRLPHLVLIPDSFPYFAFMAGDSRQPSGEVSDIGFFKCMIANETTVRLRRLIRMAIERHGMGAPTAPCTCPRGPRICQVVLFFDTRRDRFAIELLGSQRIHLLLRLLWKAVVPRRVHEEKLLLLCQLTTIRSV